MRKPVIPDFHKAGWSHVLEKSSDKLKCRKEYGNPTYLNYDNREDRDIINNESWLRTKDLLIFDEIHKMPGWRQYIKGVYDTKLKHLRILVTGSARLDTFGQTGESLAGRYFRHRLLPFTPSELSTHSISHNLDRFIERGGFPEPFLADSTTDSARWRLQYIDGLIREDIIDFQQLSNLRTIKLVLELLRSQVGSPVSLTSIAEDVGVSPNTVKKYLQILEALFIIFRVNPFSRNISRSILKEPKFFFYDTGMVSSNPGIKFENFVATCLLKYTHTLEDLQGKHAALQYLRTKEGKEIDFCVAVENEIDTMYEVKVSDPQISRSLVYFSEKYGLPGVQLVKNLKRDSRQGILLVRNAGDYLRALQP